MSIYVHLFWFFFDCKSAEMHCSVLPRQHLLSQSAFSRAHWSTGGKSKCERKLEQGRKRKQRRNPVFRERDVEVANYIEISPFLRRAEQSHTSLIPLWTLMLLWYLSHTSLTTLSWLSHTYLTYLSQPSLIPIQPPLVASSKVCSERTPLLAFTFLIFSQVLLSWWALISA